MSQSFERRLAKSLGAEPSEFGQPRAVAVPQLDATLPSYAVSGRSLFDSLRAGVRWFDEHQGDITQFLRDARQHGNGQWSYLLNLADPFTGMSLMLAIEGRRRWGAEVDDAISGVLEDGLTEPQLLDEVTDAIAAATLPETTKHQLVAGLGFVRDGDHELAVPLLINALEGAFWRLAQQRGLVCSNAKGKWIATDATGSAGKRIHSVEGLLSLPGLGLEPGLDQFLKGLAYGGSGNSYRHGTADSGWRLRSLCLHASLIGWLDAAECLDGQSVVRAAFGRAHDARSAKRIAAG